MSLSKVVPGVVEGPPGLVVKNSWKVLEEEKEESAENEEGQKRKDLQCMEKDYEKDFPKKVMDNGSKKKVSSLRQGLSQ